MKYYSRDLVATDLYDKWFRLNIIHDVDMGMVTVSLMVCKIFKQKIKDQETCTSNVGFMLHRLISATTWNQGGETSKYININWDKYVK